VAESACHDVASPAVCALLPQGYFNGFGGKVEAGETITQAAHREVRYGHQPHVPVGCSYLTCGLDKQMHCLSTDLLAC
jgi:hypothetical protein